MSTLIVVRGTTELSLTLSSGETQLIVAPTRTQTALQVSGGPPGPAGARQFYVHTQLSPSATWTVNHNFGVKPAGVQVLSPGGVAVTAQVTNISDNQLRVDFAAPQTGSVVVL